MQNQHNSNITIHNMLTFIWIEICSDLKLTFESCGNWAKAAGNWQGSIDTQGCQFCSVSSGMVETFHINSKNETKRNKFHLILNLDPFWIFRLNSTRNVPVSFHMFRSTFEKPLNQIEPYSISLIKPPDYKKLFFISIFNSNDINNNIKNYYYYFH